MFDQEVYRAERTKGRSIQDAIRNAGGIAGEREGNYWPVFHAGINPPADGTPCDWVLDAESETEESE